MNILCFHDRVISPWHTGKRSKGISIKLPEICLISQKHILDRKCSFWPRPARHITHNMIVILAKEAIDHQILVLLGPVKIPRNRYPIFIFYCITIVKLLTASAYYSTASLWSGNIKFAFWPRFMSIDGQTKELEA